MTEGDGVDLPKELHQDLGGGQGVLVVQEGSGGLDTSMEVSSEQAFQQVQFRG